MTYSTTLGALKNLKSRVRLRDTVLASLFELTHPIQKNTLAIACSQRAGFGDTYLICSLAEALCQKYNRDHITLYIKPSHRFITNLFPCVKAELFPSWYKVNHIENIRFDVHRIFYAHFPKAMTATIGYKGLTLLDAYKILFGLPENTTLTQPLPISGTEFTEAEKLLKKHNLVLSKTVIIMPEANSSDDLSLDMTKKIYEGFATQGMTPVIMAIKQERISGCTYIDIPLNLVRAVAQKSGTVVSVRSGMSDVLSNVPCTLIVLYPDITWLGGKFIDGAGVRSMYGSTSANIHEHIITSDPKLVDTITSSRI